MKMQGRGFRVRAIDRETVFEPHAHIDIAAVAERAAQDRDPGVPRRIGAAQGEVEKSVLGIGRRLDGEPRHRQAVDKQYDAAFCAGPFEQFIEVVAFDGDDAIEINGFGFGGIRILLVTIVVGLGHRGSGGASKNVIAGRRRRIGGGRWSAGDGGENGGDCGAKPNMSNAHGVPL